MYKTYCDFFRVQPTTHGTYSVQRLYVGKWEWPSYVIFFGDEKTLDYFLLPSTDNLTLLLTIDYSPHQSDTFSLIATVDGRDYHRQRITMQVLYSRVLLVQYAVLIIVYVLLLVQENRWTMIDDRWTICLLTAKDDIIYNIICKKTKTKKTFSDIIYFLRILFTKTSLYE